VTGKKLPFPSISSRDIDSGAILLNGRPGRLKPQKLRPILDGPDRGGGIESISQDLLAGKFPHRRGTSSLAAFMHQQALDRDAALTVDQEHPPENGSDRRVDVDVRQHYPASLPPNSGSGASTSGRRTRKRAAGLSGPRERNLVGFRVRRHPRADIVAAGHHV